MHIRRRGVTMTEVLIAIFICGMGLVALMTLFPLGALNMAQALKDDRCGLAAGNAAAVLRSIWRVAVQSDPDDPELKKFDNLLAAGKPLYIDPLGSAMFGNVAVGGVIPRYNFPNATYQQALSWCTLLDDLDFNPNGIAVNNGGEVSRQGRYSWAWMVRPQLDGGLRPQAIDYSVVVYQNRVQSQNPTIPAGEVSFAGTINSAGSDTASMFGSPRIKKSSWVLEATKGCFYRIVAVTNVGGNVSWQLQPPFRPDVPAGQVNLIYMDNVAEVFERSTLE